MCKMNQNTYLMMRSPLVKLKELFVGVQVEEGGRTFTIVLMVKIAPGTLHPVVVPLHTADALPHTVDDPHPHVIDHALLDIRHIQETEIEVTISLES